jgi:uncharacterized membrane protein YqjE
MESTSSFDRLGAASKQIVRQLATIGENRFELLAVEVQEERERLLHAILLALGAAGFGLLGSLTITAAIVFLLWAYAPMAVLLTLTGLYAVAGFYLYRRLGRLLRNWRMLPASLDQIHKDRAVLEKFLA